MSLCINPNCLHPENLSNDLFCKYCNSELLIAGKYRVSRLLGEGGFGKTYEVMQKGSNTPKVLKVLINNAPKAVELFEREIQSLSQLNHPGIPKVESRGVLLFYPTDSQRPLHCFVMEKIEGQNLTEYIQHRGNRPIDGKLAGEWLTELVKILDVIHQHNIIHRDIKPQNIILKYDGQLVLVDFGTVRESTTGTAMARNLSVEGTGTEVATHAVGEGTSVSSPGYAPQEQINGQAITQSDFFALGRTFVFLLTAKKPLDPSIYNVFDDQLNWRSYAVDVSPQLADLIDQMMARQPSQRPANTQEILQKLAEIDPRLCEFKTPPSRDRSVIPQPLNFQSTDLQVFQYDIVTFDNRGQEIKRKKGQAQYFINNLGKGIALEMVYIPGGTFMMGSPKGEGSDLEKPQHEVTVPSFFMGKYPVTQSQWEVVAALPKINRPLKPKSSYFKGTTRPVEEVSWYDAIEFCDRLSQYTGRSYRLPSEAEWEYACRAGTTTPFYFGETITSELANYNAEYTYIAGVKGTYLEATTEVGCFGVANAFGLYDMHGNVWEWCLDDWHDNYQGAPTDGSAWFDDNNNFYQKRGVAMLRGGSWINLPKSCRSASRRSNHRAVRDGIYKNVGLRVVCAAEKYSSTRELADGNLLRVQPES